jgi:hypothetical protein
VNKNEQHGVPWPRARSACLALAALAASATLLVTACVSQGVPLEKGYLDSGRPLFDVVLEALRDIGADVVAESPARDAVTAHLDGDTTGTEALLEVRLDRRLEDVTYVQVSVWSEAGELPREDQDLWRERFYDALDALGGSDMRRLRRPEDAGPPGHP